MIVLQKVHLLHFSLEYICLGGAGVAPGWRRVAPGGAVCSVMIVSILVQSPLVLLFPLRAVYLVQRVMHFASSRHPTDDFLLHFVHFDAKVRL